MEGVGEEVLSMELELEERAYTREEASEIYEQILEELPGHILGENPSLREVCWTSICFQVWRNMGWISDGSPRTRTG